MKKIMSLFLMLAMSAALMTGCAKSTDTTGAAQGTVEGTEESTENAGTEGTVEGEDGTEGTAEDAAEPEEEVTLRIGALKGPTAMGMVSLMNQQSGEDANYQFTIAGAADEITPLLVKGDLDFAAVPANLASVLYNNTNGAIEVVAVNTLGVIYIVENGDNVQNVEDLRGKTIYASGKGSTPEYALNYILKSNGIDPETDVTIEWKSEHTECLAALSASENAIAMLPQPFVTTAQTKIETIRIALDLTAEWNKIQKDEAEASTLITGVIVARKEILESYPEQVSAFLDAYKESVSFVNENTAKAAELVGSFDIVPADVAEIALPYCNITFMEGAEMKEKLSGYLNVLFEQNPQSVGGSLPNEDFYYAR
ncbi:MAG: ABC transporter substrate-binding protein [Lachnospiraceae bacterium]|nr:ABC transporter substrate-binding protein [Lachnospiraceae bacterium]